MRLKFLLFSLFLSCGILTAQDTVRSLILSEVYLSRADQSFVEITNMGDSALHLANFELGRLGPWSTPWNMSDNTRLKFADLDPSLVLQPGESYVIASFRDWTEEQWAFDVAHWGYSQDHNENVTKREMWSIADMQLHFPEDPLNADPTDSVSRIGDWNYYQFLETWGGRDTWCIFYWLPNGDSVLVDQFNGIFVEDDGTRIDGAMDVAGVTGASNNCVLMRKFDVTKGQPDFSKGRGNDIAESEWLPVPRLGGRLDPGDPAWEVNRAVFWTLGNHGDYHLNDATIKSSTIDINWTDTILTVPWGIRNDDSIMHEFDRVPGISWHYDFAKNREDSAYVSARTGDVLTLYASGNTQEKMRFKINVQAPTDDAKIVIPKRGQRARGQRAAGYYRCGPIPYDVTVGLDPDTIRDVPYATRVDTLFKYLEKPANAQKWEIVWVDGKQRTDLKLGDLLRVTAKNGETKDYYIKVYEYRESRNNYLSSITWPDIPDYYKGVFGWMGDTIPNFGRALQNYSVQVPYDVAGIPGLVGKTENLNAKLKVDRATSLAGSVPARTTTFTVTAENDSSVRTYKVLLNREVLPASIQPWVAEPFISQVVWQEQYANDFLEICNPGTEDLDLSNYMLVFDRNNNWTESVREFGADTNWAYRYRKYIPGYKWVDSTKWHNGDQGKAEKEYAVNPKVLPGDVFVIGDISKENTGLSGYDDWSTVKQCDIDLHNNPWNEYLARWSSLQVWVGQHYYILEIVGDSIHEGWKAANDPEDFRLVAHWGTDASNEDKQWTVGPETAQSQLWTYIRKPEYYLPDSTIPTASWGTDWDNSEWYMRNEAWFTSAGYGWPSNRLALTEDIGQHTMLERTHYRSTVASTSYLVDDGYKGDLQIRGVVTGTTVDGFLTNIIKANDKQTLTLISSADGTELAGEDVLLDGDTLAVLSADTIIANLTKYVLGVTDEGLSNNATLTSTLYTITADPVSGEGTVSGFDYGTELATIVEGVTVPAGASFAIVDADSAWVPLKMLNFDTAYVNVQVNDQTFFEVVSESGAVTILYQLKPNSSSSDAFVTSMVYNVRQDIRVIEFLPQGTNVGSFLRNLVPATGATMQLIDKFGEPRTRGTVVLDDKLVVTALDGVTKAVYYLSMLPDEGKKSDYLAFVLSDVYSVDQLELNIAKMSQDITSQTLVFTFISNLIPAEDASITAMDVSGAVKSSGNMAEGDYLMVTAANGATVVFYTIDVVAVSTEDLTDDRIHVYPNPTSGMVQISGLEIGNRIQVYSNTGMLLLDVPAYQGMETISLENQANGIYFILIRNADSILGRHSLIKQ